MGQFELYFRLGTNHILDLGGFDHILFIIVLCSSYSISDWRRIILLVTAFTIGHSITLVLATFQLLNLNSDLVEFLIPVTIAITAAGNLVVAKLPQGTQINYFFASFFGLIHGLGFSSYLRALLGTEVSILTPLFAFNVGLEAGQFLIVFFFLLLSLLPLKILKVKQRQWTLLVSVVILAIAIKMIMKSNFW